MYASSNIKSGNMSNKIYLYCSKNGFPSAGYCTFSRLESKLKNVCVQSNAGNSSAYTTTGNFSAQCSTYTSAFNDACKDNGWYKNAPHCHCPGYNFEF